ncbi:MAG: hypothetical protein NTY99_03410 [DPANN group archaeon]|nr:hypothetical protein [DPANN group archaeon]
MVQHITIKIKETPGLIKALYRRINMPSKCFYCGKPAHYLQIAVDKEKHLLTREICLADELKRRKKLWQKKKR